MRSNRFIITITVEIDDPKFQNEDQIREDFISLTMSSDTDLLRACNFFDTEVIRIKE